MGQSYSPIDVKRAKALTRSWKAVEAMESGVFESGNWKRRVTSAQIEERRERVLFILDQPKDRRGFMDSAYGFPFVVMEKGR